jgi:amino acid transporter
MELITLAIGAAILVGLGAFFVKHLGWPRDIAGMVKWGLVLVLSAVLFVGIPDLIRQFPTGAIPAVNVGAVIFALAFLALAAIGYWGWANEVGKREKRRLFEDRARSLPRRRLPPPAPRTAPIHAHDEQGFHLQDDQAFTPLGGENGNGVE